MAVAPYRFIGIHIRVFLKYFIFCVILLPSSTETHFLLFRTKILRIYDYIILLDASNNRNYNYGKIGEALKVDLLNHPEYIEQNATLAFQAALWKWMTPPEKHIPSPHDVFVGNWKPTKNDTLSKRVPGFGATINVLYGDQVCDQGSDNEAMSNIISHYLYYLDLLGVGREEAGPNEILSCAEQAAFKPTGSPSSSTT